MTNILIIISAFLLIVSKFLDCYTTQFEMKEINEENNRIAKYLMNRFGKSVIIWGVFIIVIIISILLMFKGLNTTSILYRWGFIILAVFISILQFSVAYANHTKKLTFFTRIISKFSLYKK